MREQYREKIRCRECPDLRIVRNFPEGAGRAQCICGNPGMGACYEMFGTPDALVQGFVCFLDPETQQPKARRCPHWCPRKLFMRPREVTYREAIRISRETEPRGLFLVSNGDNTFSGIDNRTGEPEVETFDRRAACMRWLLHPEERPVAV